MASIGLRYAKYNKIDYTTKKYKALTGSTVPTLGKLVDGKFTEERNDARLDADDMLAEYDSSFKSGTLNLTIADVDDETYADVKGCTSVSGEITESVDDAVPEIGYGHIVTKMINGIKKYKVEFLPRIKVTNITQDAKTKGESLEFGTASIEAKVFALNEEINGISAGTYKKIETFDTLAEAVTYLDGLLTPVA